MGQDLSEEMKITPTKLKDFEDLYQGETATKTKHKARIGLTEQKLKSILENYSNLENIKIDLMTILDKIVGKENKKKVLDIIEE